MLVAILHVGVALLVGLLIACVVGRWYYLKSRIRRVLGDAAKDLKLARKEH